MAKFKAVPTIPHGEISLINNARLIRGLLSQKNMSRTTVMRAMAKLTHQHESLGSLLQNTTTSAVIASVDLEGLPKGVIAETCDDMRCDVSTVTDLHPDYSVKVEDSYSLFKGVTVTLTAPMPFSEMNSRQLRKMLTVLVSVLNSLSHIVSTILVVRPELWFIPEEMDADPKKAFHMTGQDRFFSREWDHVLASSDSKDELIALETKLRAVETDRFGLINIRSTQELAEY